MNKKLKYLLICLPFVIGGILFSFGVYNLFSSILFFAGGYIALKNIFDYRKIIKNRNNNTPVIPEVKSSYKKDYSYRSAENIVGLKKTRRYSRIRRRVKY